MTLLELEMHLFKGILISLDNRQHSISPHSDVLSRAKRMEKHDKSKGSSKEEQYHSQHAQPHACWASRSQGTEPKCDEELDMSSAAHLISWDQEQEHLESWS